MADAGTTNAIRVRMYRVGFGECFLVSLPVDGRTEHLLIDCGVHPRGDIGTLRAVVDNISSETAGNLALVVASHAHGDHISGFARYRDAFHALKIREVWLPWTENPQDADATQLRRARAELTGLVQDHLRARPPADQAEPAVSAALENMLEPDIQAALDALRAGFDMAQVRYLDSGGPAWGLDGVDGVSVRVFWPPRDAAFQAQLNVRADQRFLRPAADGGIESANDLEPFPRQWRVDAASNKYYAAIGERDKNLLADAAWRAQGVAFELDRTTNDMSLVLLLTYRGKQLLFTGDAQPRLWASGAAAADRRALLAGLSVYKVPHHGSSNAMAGGVGDLLPAGCVAMVSTQIEPWATIPVQEHMAALASRCRAVVRSDSLPVPGAPKGPPLSELPKGVVQGDVWFDYLLPA